MVTQARSSSLTLTHTHTHSLSVCLCVCFSVTPDGGPAKQQSPGATIDDACMAQKFHSQNCKTRAVQGDPSKVPDGRGGGAGRQLLTSDRQPSTASACEAEAAVAAVAGAAAGAVSHQVTFMRNDAGLEQCNGIDASARAQRAPRAQRAEVATRLWRIEGVLST